MGDKTNPPSWPRRIWHLFGLAGALLVGVVLGIVADRFYLGTTKPAPDSRLIGKWAAEDGDYVRFREDGTFDSAGNLAVDGKVTPVSPYTGPYRWASRDTIEVYEGFGSRWVERKLVFEGDRLTMMGDGGKVRRFTREKE